jgi:hypothetical protein
VDLAERVAAWQHRWMRRPSVADALKRAERARVAELQPGERIALALALGRRSLALYCATSGLPPDEARRGLARRAQARRRRSGCLEALLE